MRRLALVLPMVLLVVGVALFVIWGRAQSIDINGKNYVFTIAKSDEEREQGLSGKTKINDDEVMIFVFDGQDKHGIWMKDMNFDIDILWLDVNGKLVGLKDNASPQSYPEVFYPEQPAQYVIEGSSSLIEDTEINIGDMVNLPKYITD